MQITLELVGSAVALFGLVGTAWWRIDGRIDQIRREGEASLAMLRRECEAAAARAAATAENLAELRVHVAETYVSTSAMHELEDRLVGAIERLGDRFDRLFEAKVAK